MSSVDAGTIFLAKATAQFIFTLLMELPTILLIILFFDLPLVQPMEFIASLLLGTVALSLVGTLFSAMLMNARMKEVLLPLVTYPLLVPVVIAGVKVTSVAVGAPVNEDAWMWLKFLLGFDMIFAVATWFLFGRMIRA